MKHNNKTEPTNVKVEDFLKTVSERRQVEAAQIIHILHTISGHNPYMWGPSIIGFGQTQYTYDTGREGDTPELGFSPRKSALTIYFLEGFSRYEADLKRLGKYKNSVSCLYINKLADIDMKVLKTMLEKSYALGGEALKKPQTVEEYIARIPTAAQASFAQLRAVVLEQLPGAKEVLSYGVIGYKIDDKRARVFISGWKDHLAMYPIPKGESIRSELKPYIKGKGTLWFSLDQPLPVPIIQASVRELATSAVVYN